MRYQYFFTDYEGEEILADNEITASKEEIIRFMKQILLVKDNFLGIIDQNDLCIQFMVNQDHSILVDIPIPELDGSHTKNTTLMGALQIVHELDAMIQIEDTDNLQFEKWLAYFKSSLSKGYRNWVIHYLGIKLWIKSW
ncbi:hypothetical protein [Acinetobacter sp. WCHAc060025]|uniref:hypothetical protein n=1 Tax=Acinetobacter sp. WCHAc060025 TaxID=2518625 RepID=UPI001023A422|nr:hypothetical protein [Acinetobacter sp. WCHAc060025]RZG72125.1 hypothetical protein EXE09_17685 [Acinetobacter sp. WCHAc060025]